MNIMQRNPFTELQRNSFNEAANPTPSVHYQVNFYVKHHGQFSLAGGVVGGSRGLAP